MSFPDYEQIAKSLLVYLYHKGGSSYSLKPKNIYDPLADLLDISQFDRKKPRPDGYSGTHWENRVQWTRQKLVNEGDIDNKIHGLWKLTPQGVNRALKLTD